MEGSGTGAADGIVTTVMPESSSEPTGSPEVMPTESTPVMNGAAEVVNDSLPIVAFNIMLVALAYVSVSEAAYQMPACNPSV